MEFKGTKGEWTLDVTKDDKYDQPVVQIDCEESGVTGLATVWTGLPYTDEVDEKTMADALLISKAPEMLGMLIHVKDYLGSDQRSLVEQLIKEATTL